MRKLSIAIVTDHFFSTGGIETQLKTLCHSLINLSNNVIVICPSNRTGITYYPFNSLTIKVYTIKRRNLVNGVTVPYFIITANILKKIFVENKIDIIHCNQSISSLSLEAVLFSKVLNVKTCFTEHSIFSNCNFLFIFLNCISRCILNKSDIITGVSKYCSKNLAERLEIDENKVFTVYNSIDSNLFNTKFISNNKTSCINTKCNKDLTVENEDCLLSLFSNIRHDNFKSIDKSGNQLKISTLNKTIIIRKTIIAIATRLEARKGINLLVKVFKLLFDRTDEFIIKIAGEGSKRILIEEFIETNNLHNKVILLGNIEHSEMPLFYKTSHLFLNCSLTDSFCISILEAASCGLYVISTDVGGICEVLPDENICLTKVCEKTICENIILSKTKSDNLINVEYIHDKYSCYKTARQYLSLYHEALNNKKKENNQSWNMKNIIEIFLLMFFNLMVYIFALTSKN